MSNFDNKTTTLLSLNNDCLLELLSFIYDFHTFYNFCLTCKRLYQVSLDARGWHVNIIKRKIRFYGTRFVINAYSKDSQKDEKVASIDDLLWMKSFYDHLTIRPTLPNVRRIWELKGPVAVHLFTLIEEVKTRHPNGKAHYSKIITFRLPKCQQILKLEVFFDRNSDELVFLKAYFEEGHPILTKLTAKRIRANPKQCLKWNESEIKENIVDLSQIINILQKEFGETNYPITGHFILWFCFLPESLEYEDLGKEKCIFFTDNDKNTEPDDELLKNCFQCSSSVQRIGESTAVTIISETVESLHPRSKAKILEDLSNDIFFHSNWDTFLRDQVPDDILLKIILRTSFSPSCRSIAKVIGDFNLKDGKTIAIELTQISEDLIDAKFFLPNEKKIVRLKLPCEAYLEGYWPVRYHQQFLANYKGLQPVTDLFEQCINDGSRTRNVKLNNNIVWAVLLEISFTAWMKQININKERLQEDRRNRRR